MGEIEMERMEWSKGVYNGDRHSRMITVKN